MGKLRTRTGHAFAAGHHQKSLVRVQCVEYTHTIIYERKAKFRPTADAFYRLHISV